MSQVRSVAARVRQSGVRFATDQRLGFAGLKVEVGGEQVLHAIAFPCDAVRAMAFRVGKDVIQLMRQHAAQGAPENRFAVVRANRQEFLLDEAADGRTIHVGEWQDGAAANVGPAQRAGVGVVRDQAGNVAAAFKVDDRQFDRWLPAAGSQVPPLEVQAHGFERAAVAPAPGARGPIRSPENG